MTISTSGSVDPFRLFLVFNELVDAELRKAPGFAPAYMIDQSHNVTDPIESLMQLGDRDRCAPMSRPRLSTAKRCSRAGGKRRDVAIACLSRPSSPMCRPILAEARRRKGGAIDPIATYRASGYRREKTTERPPIRRRGSGNRLNPQT